MIWPASTRSIGIVFVALGWSEWLVAEIAPNWVRTVALEIQAACRDVGTQWMVVTCLLSYLIVFVVIEAKSKAQGLRAKVEATLTSPRPAPLPAGAARVFPPSSILHPLSFILSPNFWLGVFVVLVLLRYAFDYAAAAKSLQVVVLLTGLVVGKGIALWVSAARGGKFQVSSFKSKAAEVGRVSPLPAEFTNDTNGAHGVTRPTLICSILLFLLACAALWQPERGMEFQYRGQRRWTGVWDNPNLYGVLMGVGFTLAVGMLVQRLKSKGSSRANADCGLRSAEYRRWGSVLFFGIAAGLCGFGLLKSYSRGAWLGTAVGIGFLIWKFFNREPHEIREKEIQSNSPLPTLELSRIWRISRLQGIWFPSSILILSILVICFWQFRQTESPVLRRVFSVGNPNDFSWRNRVAAWEGAGLMMWDKPLAGFGWGKAEEIYGKEYRAARLEESAAVQLNDYLMIGISAGTPALGCLLGYLWLALLRNAECGVRNKERPVAAGLPASDLRLETLAVAAKAGAMVLLIGFWFDGGLFKLPTCAVFWVLVELARGEVSTTKLASQARHDIVVLDQKDRSRGCVVTKPTKDEGRARHSGRAVGDDNETDARHLTQSPLPACGHPLPVGRGEGRGEGNGAQRTARPTFVLRWLSGLVALVALGLTTLHLGTPQLAVSERTLSLARKFIVPPSEKADFEYLAAKNIWSNTPLKTLLQHAHLANYNRTLVNWKLEDQMYRECVLSPEISPAPGLPATLSPSDGERGNAALVTDTDGAPGVARPTSQPSTRHGWRRPLWEYFYPRIRKESSLEAAAEIIVRQLRERISITGSSAENSKLEIQNSKLGGKQNIAEIWRHEMASDAEFERLAVAAMRAVGIPARLTASGQAEFWNGAEWKPAPRRA